MDVHILRHIARIWSIASITFVLLFFIGAGYPNEVFILSLVEWIAVLFFPIGVLVGLAFAWWHEGFGGGLAAVSALLFYLWNFALVGHFPAGPFFVLITMPGVLFLVYWLLSLQQQTVATQ